MALAKENSASMCMFNKADRFGSEKACISLIDKREVRLSVK
jgi:hypothetical protein